MQVCDFLDNEHLSHLESVLVQICPREVILPQSELAAIKKVRQIVERNRILVTSRPTPDFGSLQVKMSQDPTFIRFIFIFWGGVWRVPVPTLSFCLLLLFPEVSLPVTVSYPLFFT